MKQPLGAQCSAQDEIGLKYGTHRLCKTWLYKSVESMEDTSLAQTSKSGKQSDISLSLGITASLLKIED